jgi:uncharacterized protein (TIGR02996 family)
MFDADPKLVTILTAIRARPDDRDRWLALASWLWDNDRDDEAVAVRVFWPNLRDSVLVEGHSMHATLRYVAPTPMFSATRRGRSRGGPRRRRPRTDLSVG